MEDRLEQIKAREQAATEGPWIHNQYYECIQTANDNVKLYAVARYGNGPRTDADFDFLAAARGDVPWLIEQIEELRRVLAPLIRDPLRSSPMDGGQACLFCEEAVYATMSYGPKPNTLYSPPIHGYERPTHKPDCPALKADALLGRGPATADST